MAALPANVATCLVTGRFIRAVVDSPADGDREPEGIPLPQLDVVFDTILNPPMVRNATATPPVTIALEKISCRTNADGVLVGPDGTAGIRLVASDDPDLDPSGWSWRVTVSGPGFPKSTFSFIAPSGGTVDLASVIPVPASPGAEVVAWQLAVGETAANVVAAQEAVADAVLAKDAAEDAQAAAEAVPLSNDPIVAALLEDPDSDTAIAAASTMVPRSTVTPAAMLAIPNRLDNVWRYQQSSYSQDNIVTLDDGTVYAVWLRAGDVHPIVGKLVPGATAWETFDLRTISGDPFGAQAADGHNTFVLGVDSSGNIHVSGNMHSVVLKYARTTVPGDITSFASASMVGTQEGSVTYPNFVTNSAGTLYFAYRNGGSSSGTTYLNRWAGSAWARVGPILDGDTSGEAPYMNRIAPDRVGGLHFMFMWREAPEAETNTDIGYVYRAPDGSWKKSDGSAQTMPVTHANCETVLPFEHGAGLINQTGLDVDRDGHPHGVFTWYDSNGKSQYYHVHHDGSTWHTDQVSVFTDRVETLSVSTLNLIVARPQIVCTSTGGVYVLGRAKSTLNNRPHIIDVTKPGNPISPLFDMDLSVWEAAYDLRSLRRSDTLRMLVTDLESPASTGHGYTDQWGGILSIDLRTLPVVAGSRPQYGRVEAGRATDITVRGALTSADDLDGFTNLQHVGSWLGPTGINVPNRPSYGVVSPSTIVVSKPHRAVTVQNLFDATGKMYTRSCVNGTWTAWTLVTGGSYASLANATTISTLWHGDYLLSSGAGNAYPGEPADFAALNVAGVLEVRQLSASGGQGIRFYRLTTFDRTRVWEATLSSGSMSAWTELGKANLSASTTWDPASLASGASVLSADITLTGAVLGDALAVSSTLSLGGLIATAYVKAANTVVIVLANLTGGAVDLASSTWKVRVVGR